MIKKLNFKLKNYKLLEKFKFVTIMKYKLKIKNFEILENS